MKSQIGWSILPVSASPIKTLKRKEISLVDPINIGNTDNDYVSNNNIISSNRSNRTHSIRVIADEYNDAVRSPRFLKSNRSNPYPLSTRSNSGLNSRRLLNHSIVDRGNPIHRTTTYNNLLSCSIRQGVDNYCAVAAGIQSIKNHLFERHFNSSPMTRLIASNSNKNHINFRIAFTINFDFRRVGSKLTNFLGGHVTLSALASNTFISDPWPDLTLQTSIGKDFHLTISLGQVWGFHPVAKAYTNQTASNSKLPALPEALKDTNLAIEVNPNFTKAYIRKALTLLAMKDCRHNRSYS
ncbi:hypothetical protein BY996DRAFT_6587350 [Phakopsora pachyrhizi]|nr:hypothetical protein BY996DRAFT_6587350 [Phakopsora pachyrhizi]